MGGFEKLKDERIHKDTFTMGRPETGSRAPSEYMRKGQWSRAFEEKTEKAKQNRIL